MYSSAGSEFKFQKKATTFVVALEQFIFSKRCFTKLHTFFNAHLLLYHKLSFSLLLPPSTYLKCIPLNANRQQVSSVSATFTISLNHFFSTTFDKSESFGALFLKCGNNSTAFLRFLRAFSSLSNIE